MQVLREKIQVPGRAAVLRRMLVAGLLGVGLAVLQACGGGGGGGGADGTGSVAGAPSTPSTPDSGTGSTPGNGSSSGSGSTPTTPPAVTETPVIVVGTTEPLEGTVRLSLSGTASGSVTWFVDSRLLGTGNANDQQSIQWTTTGVADGNHLLQAVWTRTDSSPLELRRTVQVANPTLTLNPSVSGVTGTIAVNVRAASAYGVRSVSARFDGQDLGTLTQPNACSRFCSGGNDLYRFTVDAAVAGTGAHTMVITGIDNNGSTRSASVSVPIDNAPVLNLTAPANGVFVHGLLRVQGTVSSDKPGAVTVTAQLNDITFLTTTASAYLGSYDLSGFTAGPYTLTVRATDSTGKVTQNQRTVLVTSTAALAYTPLFSLPAGGQLLGAETDIVLYQAGAGGPMVLRRLSTGTEATLEQSAAIQYVRGWKLDGGRVVAFGSGQDCAPSYCVYLWNSAGTITNLTPRAPGASVIYHQHPVLRGDWLVWSYGIGVSTSHQAYQLSTGRLFQVASDASLNYAGNWNYDFRVDQDAMEFWFWGNSGGEGVQSRFDVYRWRSDTGLTTRITQDGFRNVYTRVSADRVAWERSPVGGNADGSFEVMATTGADSTPRSVSPRAVRLLLADGIVAWEELAGTTSTSGRSVRAQANGMTTTLSTLTGAHLLAVSPGQVIYAEDGKVYRWNSAQRVSTVRMEASPSQVFVTPAGQMIIEVLGQVYGVGP